MPVETLHILIVKENANDRRGLFQFLHSKSHSPIGYDNKRIALEALGNPNIPWDAVVCGENLADGSGMDFYRDLRKHSYKGAKSLPIVFWTGFPWYQKFIANIEAEGEKRMKWVRSGQGTDEHQAILDAIIKLNQTVPA